MTAGRAKYQLCVTVHSSLSIYSSISETGTGQKRKAPSSSASSSRSHSLLQVTNLADLSPQTLREMEKAAEIAAKETPAVRAEVSRIGKERHAAEICTCSCSLRSQNRQVQPT